MVEVPLRNGMVALVDDEDAPRIMEHRWSANRIGRIWYAIRRVGTSAPGKNECKTILMHREILGATERSLVDHANRDGLDNRRANLRLANRSENAANMVAHRDNRSGFKGVFWNTSKGKWEPRIYVRGKAIWLGRYSDKEEAARVYDDAARREFGEFARPNKTGGT